MKAEDKREAVAILFSKLSNADRIIIMSRYNRYSGEKNAPKNKVKDIPRPQ